VISKLGEKKQPKTRSAPKRSTNATHIQLLDEKSHPIQWTEFPTGSLVGCWFMLAIVISMRVCKRTRSITWPHVVCVSHVLAQCRATLMHNSRDCQFVAYIMPGYWDRLRAVSPQISSDCLHLSQVKNLQLCWQRCCCSLSLPLMC
jgi:hypothetical protein